MNQDVKGSQFADRGGSITNSTNKSDFSINKIRKETAIISFVVGFLSSLFASYIYEHFLK